VILSQHFASLASAAINGESDFCSMPGWADEKFRSNSLRQLVSHG